MGKEVTSADPSLFRAVATVLRRKGLTVSTAESCTAGGLGWALTVYPGSSNWFRGGILAYANEIKEEVLHVPGSLLQTHGAVSEPVACTMAEQVRKILKADIGVGITGIAGPFGGTAEKPVGTVWCAVSTTGRCTSRRGEFKGTRKAIRRKAIRFALELMLETIGDG
jgi:PncC family amidohydrolase